MLSLPVCKIARDFFIPLLVRPIQFFLHNRAEARQKGRASMGRCQTEAGATKQQIIQMPNRLLTRHPAKVGERSALSVMEGWSFNGRGGG